MFFGAENSSEVLIRASFEHISTKIFPFRVFVWGGNGFWGGNDTHPSYLYHLFSTFPSFCIVFWGGEHSSDVANCSCVTSMWINSFIRKHINWTNRTLNRRSYNPHAGFLPLFFSRKDAFFGLKCTKTGPAYRMIGRCIFRTEMQSRNMACLSYDRRVQFRL